MVVPWTQLLLLLLGAVCAAQLFRIWWSRTRLRELASLIPGPRGLPIIGNVLLTLGGSEKMHRTFINTFNTYGDTVAFWMGPKLYIGIVDPHDVETVLCNTPALNRDSYLMKVIEPFMGQGLITGKFDLWKRHRKIITPTFHVKILETFLHSFNNNAQIIADKLHTVSDGESVNLVHLIGPCTLDTISETVLGTKISVHDKCNDNLHKASSNMIELIQLRGSKPWLMIDWLFSLTEMGRLQEATKKMLHELAETTLTKKMNDHREKSSTKLTSSAQPDVGEKQRKAFLDLILDSSESEGVILTQDELRDEVYTLMFTGQETIATTTCYVLTMLALLPHYQELVFQELQEVFQQDSRRPVTWEDLPKLKYLERVIMETQRLHTVTTLLPREITEEMKLSKYTIPAGCTAVVFSHSTHRDPRYFPDPEKFDPDRFLPENVKARPQCSFLPFGAGPRMCVGYKYAMILMKVILATVLRRYRVLPVTTQEDLKRRKLSIVSKPVDDFQSRVVPRDV